MEGVLQGILRSSVLCQFLNFSISVQNEDALPGILQMRFVSAQHEVNSGQNRSRNSRRIVSCWLPVCSLVQNKLFHINVFNC